MKFLASFLLAALCFCGLGGSVSTQGSAPIQRTYTRYSAQKVEWLYSRGDFPEAVVSAAKQAVRQKTGVEVCAFKVAGKAQYITSGCDVSNDWEDSDGAWSIYNVTDGLDGLRYYNESGGLRRGHGLGRAGRYPPFPASRAFLLFKY